MPYVTVALTQQVGKGQMNISAVVPQERVNLVQLLPALKQVTSNIVNAVSAAVHSEGYEISCRAGCGACCRQLVPLTLFEAEELAQWILSLPADQQAIVEGRFHNAMVKLKASGVLARLDLSQMPDADVQQTQELALEYLKVGVPCPFLQDESCGIHPIRPLICREYLVTSPPEFCSHPTAETVKPVPMPVRLSRALIHMGARITEEKQGWLPLTFLFAWIRSGAKVGGAYEGTGPELLQQILDETQASNSTPDAS